MELFHCTPFGNRPAIGLEGLLVERTQGKYRAVWLASARWMHWAWMHVAMTKAVPVSEVICFPIDVPREWLTYRRRGIWLCTRDIAPNRIGEPIQYADLFGGRT